MIIDKKFLKFCTFKGRISHTGGTTIPIQLPVTIKLDNNTYEDLMQKLKIIKYPNNGIGNCHLVCTDPLGQVVKIEDFNELVNILELKTMNDKNIDMTTHQNNSQDEVHEISETINEFNDVSTNNVETKIEPQDINTFPANKTEILFSKEENNVQPTLEEEVLPIAIPIFKKLTNEEFHKVSVISCNFICNGVRYKKEINSKGILVCCDNAPNKLITEPTLLAVLRTTENDFNGYVQLEVTTSESTIGTVTLAINDLENLIKIQKYLPISNFVEQSVQCVTTPVIQYIKASMCELNKEINVSCPFEGTLTCEANTIVCSTEGFSIIDAYSGKIQNDVNISKVVQTILLNPLKYLGCLTFQTSGASKEIYDINASNTLLEWYSASIDTHISNWLKNQGKKIEDSLDEIQGAIDNAREELQKAIQNRVELSKYIESTIGTDVEEQHNEEQVEEKHPEVYENQDSKQQTDRQKRIEKYMTFSREKLLSGINAEGLLVDVTQDSTILAQVLGNAVQDKVILRKLFLKTANKKEVLKLARYIGIDKKTRRDYDNLISVLEDNKKWGAEAILFAKVTSEQKKQQEDVYTIEEYQAILSEIGVFLENETSGTLLTLLNAKGLDVTEDDLHEDRKLQDCIGFCSTSVPLFIMKLAKLIGDETITYSDLLALIDQVVYDYNGNNDTDDESEDYEDVEDEDADLEDTNSEDMEDFL